MKNGKSQMLRNLLVEGINAAVRAGQVDLESQKDVEGKLAVEIHGYYSIIEWCGIGHGEVSFRVFWAVNAEAKGSKKYKRLDGEKITYHASVAGWLERKDGKWVQGEGGSSLTQMYLSEFAKSNLLDLGFDGAGFEVSGPDRLPIS